MTIVTAIPSGRLGNLLFIMFTTIAYALEYNLEYVFLRNYEHNYWETAFQYLKQYSVHRCPTLKYYTIKETKQGFTKLPEPNCQYPLIKLSGYFQSAKYFDQYREQIFEIFNIDEHLKNCEKTLSETINIELLKQSTTIHFRLGDYKTIGLQMMPIEYYITGIKYIVDQEHIKYIFYFCEEENIADVQQMITILMNHYPNIKFIKISNQYNPWTTLLAMSLAKNNIIANSSFSWWGAYFNQNPTKKIVYPHPWLFNDSGDIGMSNWHRINV